jgi:predicted transcriptional regulator
MSTVTLRIPDDTCRRLTQLAAARGMSLNRLMEELGVAALAAHDAETRFHAAAARGDRGRAIEVLDRLDGIDRAHGSGGAG